MGYAEALVAGAELLGLSLPGELVSAMALHFTVLTKWASRMNITAVLDPEQAAILHGLDCLLLAEAFAVDDESQVIDVGSGGGFPGIVLALARPRLKMTLLEPQRKRASFLRVALSELDRKDVKVVEGRLEPVSPRHPPLDVDVLVSRATIPPLDLVAMAGPHLRTGGRLFLMSGAGAPSPERLDAHGREGGLRHAHRITHQLPEGQVRFIDRLEKSENSASETR